MEGREDSTASQQSQKGNGGGLGTAQDIFKEFINKAMARQCSASDELETDSPARGYLLFRLTPGTVGASFCSLDKV